MALKYLGILDGSGSVWGVRIPDLIGVYGGGDTPEEAIESAVEAATIYIADMERQRRALPKPRALEAIRAELEDGERAVEIPVVPKGE